MDFDLEFGEREKGLESDGDSDLTQAHVAAASGDVAMLVQAIQHDPGVIQQHDGDGYTPLAHAVQGQHLHAVKRLVKMGADVNAQDSQGRTYLAMAAYQGWPEGVLYLLRKGARQSIVDKSGRTPLTAATYDVDSRSITALLKRLPKEDVNAADNEKMTALHWAAFHDRPEHVRLLLNKGADPLVQDIDGKTALHWAAQNGSRSCCNMLSENDVTSGLLRIVDNTNKSVAHLAAAAGKAQIISDLAKHAPDLLESRDHDDRTPLHWSAAMGHANCVKVLVELGVSPDPMDADGTTPLQYAKQAKHTQCVDLLEGSLRIKQNHKHKGKRESLTSGDSKKSGGGFFKGLFGKKEKQKPSNENTQETPRAHLPKVSVNGKTQMTAVVGTNGGHIEYEAGSKTMAQNNKERASKRASGVPVLDSDITDGARNRNVTEDLSAIEQTEHRKKKKKHKKKQEQEADRLSSPSTSKTSSTWNSDKSTGENYTSRLRNTHLSPLSTVRPPSISPVLGDPGRQEQVAPLRRQGELSPLRRTGPDNGLKTSPVPPTLSKLKARDRHTPTPPPNLSPKTGINARKALPEISPLTQNMESLQLEKRKRKSKTKSQHDYDDYSRHEYNDGPTDRSSFGVFEDGQNGVSAEEGGPWSDRFSESSDRTWTAGQGVEFPRHPSDDAISLYKLRHKKSNQILNEESFCEYMLSDRFDT